ncbi:peptidylprolyl isomerase [Streptomyces scabiei]|uniref:peptidylprolyl isomerase n=1 Tax=Streptomyces scabiei TaxID=1930 RepID=UPI000765BE38|nr:peptidylprolyl isomerase [Streptomyces scabiei]
MSKVKLSTNHGDIVLQLDDKKAPLTVSNFLQNVQGGYYDNTLFHRVIDGFIVQGGSFEPGMSRKKQSRSPIHNEADNGVKNTAYSVAMTRTMEPHSATAEFYINLAANDLFDHTDKTVGGWGYAVFGQVTEGREVVDKIAAVSTGSSDGRQDVPKDDVVIKSAEIIG